MVLSTASIHLIAVAGGVGGGGGGGWSRFFVHFVHFSGFEMPAFIVNKRRCVIKAKSSKWKQWTTHPKGSMSVLPASLSRCEKKSHNNIILIVSGEFKMGAKKDTLPLIWWNILERLTICGRLKALYKNRPNKGSIMRIHQTAVKHWFPFPTLATTGVFSITLSFKTGGWVYPQHASSMLSAFINCHLSTSPEKQLVLLDWREELRAGGSATRLCSG